MGRNTGRAIEPMIFGQNPARKAAIEAQLFADFEPNDVLEEIWLSDIAVLTAAIEYYRKLEAALLFKAAQRHGLDEKLNEEFSGHERPPLFQLTDTRAFLLAASEFNLHDLANISAITDLISKTRRERERVYLLFERKRRPALLHAMKLAETAKLESYTVEDLGD